MKKILSLFFLLFLMLVVLFSATPSQAAGGTVVQIGDSLTVGMHEVGIEDKYKAAGWTAIVPGDPSHIVTGNFCSGAVAGYPCHGVSGGNSPTGIEAVDINKAAIQSASAIVIQLGTNKLEGNDTDAFKNAMTQMISKIKAINSGIKIYWVNLATMVDIDSYNTRNNSITEVAQTNGVVVIDWHSKVFSSGSPSSQFGSDGIHLTGQGYTAMADFIVSAVNNGGGGSSGSTAVSNTTSCTITKVGNPAGPPPPLPPECSSSVGDTSGIVGWADKITQSLQKGYDGYFDKMEGDICNDGYCAHKEHGTSGEDTYWCTFLVIDAYNLAGKKGLEVGQHLAVLNMMKFWQSTPGYIFLPYDPDNTSNPTNKDTLQKIKPGMPYFFADNPNQTIEREHTAILKEVQIDANGNGKFVTLESNSTDISHTFIVANWVVTNSFYKLRGFGGF